MTTPQNKTLISSGTRQDQRQLADLLPDAFSVEERSITEWLEYLKKFAAWLQYHTPNGVEGNWQALFDEPEGLEQWAQWLDKQPGISSAVKQRAASPDRALILTFLSILRNSKDQFRRITDRHLSYYYRDVLGFTEQSAVGDSAHIVMTLEDGAEIQTLPQGVLFDGGTDSADDQRFYRLQETTAINHSRIESLRTLGLDTDSDNTGFLRTELINAEKDLEFPESGALTFGEYETLEEDLDQRQSRPQIGLLMTSPLLWLSEGKRKITIKFYNHDTVGNALPDDLESFFNIAISTAGGLLTLPKYCENKGEQDCILPAHTFILELDDLFPAVTELPEPVSPRITAPFIQLTLKNNDSRFKGYQVLRQVALAKVELSVEVTGLKQVLIRNDDAPLDPGGPMEIFGTQPRTGSRIQFSHPELALKPLTSLDVSIDWANKPDDISKYYEEYRTYLASVGDSRSATWPEHTVNISSAWSKDEDTVTANSALYSDSGTSTISRGTSETEHLYPQGLKWELFRNLPHDNPEPRSWPFWYSMVLAKDDFGHSLYNNAIVWAATENSQNLIRFQSNLPSQTQEDAYYESLAEYTANLEKYNQYQDELARWNDLTFFTITSAENASTGRVAGIYDKSGARLTDTDPFTFAVCSYNTQNDSWRHTYFTIRSSQAAQDMVTEIDQLTTGTPVFILSGTASDYDDHINDNLQDTLANAIANCGGSSSGFKGYSALHGAYMLIGQKGLSTGQGYEFSAGSHDSYAAIEHKIALVQDTFLSPANSAEFLDGNTSPPTPVSHPGPIPQFPIPSYTPIEVNPPLTPITESFSVNYTASTELNVDNAQGENDRLLMHLHPIGTQVLASSETLGASNQHPMIPSLEKSGYLYIGFANTPDTGTLNVLFEIASIDSPPELSEATVRWDYLKADGWTEFSTDRQQEGARRAMVLGDETNNLINTGVIRFELLPDMRRSGAFAGDNQLWLRASLNNAPSRVKSEWSRLTGIYTQAATVVFSKDNPATGQAVTPLHLPEPLPAETIASLQENNPAIASVMQPSPSFGGRAPEASETFNNRVSERLRHRGRAITCWDYERLVLEQFPELFMAKCIRGSEQGTIVLQVIPKTTDPTVLKPRAPLFLQNEIRSFLSSLTPPQSTVSVIAPRFQEVRLAISLNIRDGYDQGLMIQTLNNEIVSLLSPWTGANSSEFRNTISLTSIAQFAATRPYIDQVLKITAERQEWDISEGKLKFKPVLSSVIYPDDKRGNSDEVILVPAKLHTISVSPAGVTVFEGIGRMKLEQDFKVAQGESPTDGISMTSIVDPDTALSGDEPEPIVSSY